MFAFNRQKIVGSVQSKGRTTLAGAANNYTSSMTNIWADYSTSVLEGVVTDTSERALNALYREIYIYDTVAGPAVDLMSTLPWSNFTLQGIDDKKVLQIYQDSLEELDIINLMIQATVSYQTLGKLIGSLIFNDTKGIFTDLIVHNPDDCEVIPIPLRGYDPKINLKISPEFKKFLKSKDPRDREAISEINPRMLQKLNSGKVELEPLNTIYLARASIPGVDSMSYYTRVLPIWLVEKALMRGTIIGAWRRQRSILHVMIGDDEWEPTDDQLQAIAGLFTNADQDPQGAVVVTRPGVETNEIRTGTDFWKVSDEWDVFSAAKMRALGINEEFLSGNANYNCYAKGTLVPTEKGLLPIESIVEHKGKKGSTQEIDLLVGSLTKPRKAKVWLNSGKAPCLKLTTNTGNHISCTYKNPLLTLKNDKLKWTNAEDIKIGDYLCMNPEQLTRKTKLKLDLQNQTKDCGTGLGRQYKQLKKPKYMTPDLAFFMAMIVAEGTICAEKGAYRVQFSNSNTSLIKRFEDIAKNTFGLETTKGITHHAGQKKIILGRECNINHDCYQVNVYSKTLCDWLIELGLSVKSGKKSKSYYKVVPWSILQADEQSQLAFIAAYIECDGTVRENDIKIFSTSKKLLSQMQIMLNSHGIFCFRRGSITISTRVAYSLWQKIKDYMVTKEYTYNPEDKSYKPITSFGIPTEYFRDFINNKKIKQSRGCVLFKNKKGKTIALKGMTTIVNKVKNGIFLYKESYERGLYTNFLSNLKKLDIDKYNNLIKLLECGYYFVKVTDIKDIGMKDTFDMSMRSNEEPAFIVNGIIGRNTMDVAMSVFMESLKSLRDYMTRNILYNKIFLLLAKYHSFRKRTTAELTHNIRYNLKSEKVPVLASDIRVLGMKNMAEVSSYTIPVVHWNKDLSAKSDSTYMDILNTATEKGIPVPLAMIASAAGLEMDKVLESLPQDIELRKKIKQYKDDMKKAGLGPVNPEEDMGSDGDMLSSVRLLAKNVPDEIILTRKELGHLLKNNTQALKMLKMR